MSWIDDRFADSGFIKFIATKLFDKNSRIRLYEKIAALVGNGKQLQSSVENLLHRAEKKSKSDVTAVILRDVVFQLKQGRSLGQALDKYIPMGERILIIAGEKSGTLPDTLLLCANTIKASKKMTERAIFSILQPFFLLFALATSLFLISKLVIPKLELVYPTSKWEGSAKALALLSEFVNSPWFVGLIILFFVICIVIAVTLPHWTGKVRVFFDKLPPWSFYRILQGSAWLLSLSALIKSGTTLHESIHQMRKIANDPKVGNKWFHERMDLVLLGINNGMNIGLSLEATGTGFPDNEIIDDLIVYGDLHNFDQTLYKIGQESIQTGLEKIDSQAAILKIVVKILFGISVAIFATGIISVEMQIVEYFNAVGGI